MRNWQSAHAYLDEADVVTRESRNLYAELFAFAARLRTLSQQGLC
jgi:hypothetical protein